MPTLEELYQQQLARQTAAAAPGMGGALGFAKGFAFNTPLRLLQGIGHTVANVGQVLASPLGVEVPYATNAPAQSVGEGASQLANALLLGIPEATQRRYTSTLEAEGPTENFDQKLRAGLGALGETLLMDVLPGNEVVQLYKQQDAEGNPLSTEAAGEATGMGLLKAAPFAKGLGKAQTLLGEHVGKIETLGVAESRFLRKAISEGELRAEIERAGSADKVFQGKLPPTLGAESLKDRLAREANFGDTALEAYTAESKQFSRPLLQEAFDAAHGSEVRAKVYQDLVAAGKPISVTARTAEIINEFDRQVKAGEIDIKTTGDPLGALSRKIARDYGKNVDDVPGEISLVLQNTASIAGQDLAIASKAADTAFGKLWLKAYGTPGDEALTALREIQTLEKMNSIGKETSGWSKAAGWMQTAERGRRAMMVGQLTTSLRNAVGQGITGVMQLVEDTITGLTEAAVGKVKGEGRPIKDYFGDLSSSINAFVSRTSRTQRQQLDQFLKSLPLVKMQLEGASQFEIGSNLMATILKAKGENSLVQAMEKAGVKNPKGYFNAALDTVNTFNHLQEMEFRRIFFQGRLDANLKRIGVKDFHELMDVVKSAKEGLSNDGKWAVADALEHALKQTYSYNPNGGMASWILKTYQKIPFLSAIAPPFPRFLINQYRYQLEHSPTIWFNMLTPKFRDILMEGAEGGFRSADAARVLGKAGSGLFMLNAAHVIRGSEQAGPKYYQFKPTNSESGEVFKMQEGGEIQYMDIRPYQPFASYMFVADAIRHAKDGTPMNLSPNEYTDAIAGIRRIGEMEMFALVDQLRALKSGDPETFSKAIRTPIGQYFSSFFTPLHTLREIAGAAGAEDYKYQRDVSGQELSGPIRQIIAPASLPKRIDPFTGKPMELEHPIAHQFLGLSVEDVTKMENVVYSTPNATVSQLVGQYQNAEADALVAKNIGKLLQTQVPGGSTFGTALAESIEARQLPPAYQKMAVDEIFKALRGAAYSQALAENPQLFATHILKSLLPGVLGSVARRLGRQIQQPPQQNKPSN